MKGFRLQIDDGRLCSGEEEKKKKKLEINIFVFWWS